MAKDATTEATVGNALEAVPSMLSPLAMQQINSGTLDIPLGLKLFIDAVLEPTAAILVSE